LVACLLLASTAALVVAAWRGGPKVDPVLAEAWGSLARLGANVVICIATPPQLEIPPYLDEPGPVRLGEVLGLITTVRTLDRMGVDFQILAEKNVEMPALRGRNLVLYGNPESSTAAARLLERARLTIAYDTERRERVVRSTRGGPDAVAYVPKRNALGELTDVFGLLTVMPSEGDGVADTARTVIVSCTNSAGCQAAVEFFSSASSMRGLRDRLRGENQDGFPPAYQVVVRCRVEKSQALSGEYEAHVVLPQR
jgi:hypothetical protein